MCYIMTINKYQYQLLNYIKLYFLKWIFYHKKIYIALLKVTSTKGLRVLIVEKMKRVTITQKKVAYNEIFNKLSQCN